MKEKHARRILRCPLGPRETQGRGGGRTCACPACSPTVVWWGAARHCRGPLGLCEVCPRTNGACPAASLGSSETLSVVVGMPSVFSGHGLS